MCLIALDTTGFNAPVFDVPGPNAFDVPGARARPLWLAANRDEFHARPARALGFWPEDPRLLGGRDLPGGGGWLLAVPGGARGLAFAALTNVREPGAAARTGAPSRGALVVDAARAAGDGRLAAWLEEARVGFGAYPGFNLLVAEGGALYAAGNRPEPFFTPLAPGRYGLSNAALDTPWPKLLALRGALADARDEVSPADTEGRLWAALAIDTPAPDALLPDTGVGRETERLLSSPFIRGAAYGTRCSTLLHADAAGRGFMAERRFGPGGVFLGETRVAFGETRGGETGGDPAV